MHDNAARVQSPPSDHSECASFFKKRLHELLAQSSVKQCFRSTTLKRLGLRIQLGHPVGMRCMNPVSAKGGDFTIIDTTGIHSVALDFCGCGHAESCIVQLLRHRLFPATTTYPQTAVTFRVLESFHLLSTQSKVSAVEYYASLARLSDNTGLEPSKMSTSVIQIIGFVLIFSCRITIHHSFG